MRLHRLELCGIGPFPTAQVIDFARLADAGLFLLEGPTGSGKSTIIDAIIFALYGSVAGREADNGRLVSDYLPTGTQPHVELVFETGHGHRIRRSPAYDRPKARGTGTVTENTKVALVRLAGPSAEAGEPVSTRVQEVAQEILTIVGLDKDQFTSTIVLPQGEFARFLKAPGPERRPILQKIFQTDRYLRLQERLRDRSRDARRDRELASAAVAAELGTFHFVSSGSSPEAPAALDSADDPAIELALTSRVAELAAEEQAAVASMAAATRGLDQARERQSALAARCQRRDRVRDALDRLSCLTQAAELQVRRRDELDAAARAARVGDALNAQARSAVNAANADGALEQVRAALPRPLRAAGLDFLEDHQREQEAVAAELGPTQTLEQGLMTRRDALAALSDTLSTQQAVVDGADGVLAKLPAMSEGAQRRREAAAAALAQLPGLQLQAEACDRRSAAALEVVQARAEQEAASELARDAVSHLTRAEAAVDQLRRRYLEGLAAELADDLETGRPCPVCGSAEHPAPAAAGLDHVARATVEAAEAAVGKRRDDVETAKQAVGVKDQDVARLSEAAQGLTSQDALAASRTAAAALESAKHLAGQLNSIDAELAGLVAELDAASQRRAEAHAEVARLTGLIEVDQGRLTTDERTVEQGRDGHPSVEGRIAAIRATANLIGATVGAGRVAANAQAALDQSRQDLRAALAREGFTRVEEVRAAHREASVIEALEASINQHLAEQAMVDGILAEPELAGVDPEGAIDLGPAQDAVAQATEQQEVEVGAHGQATVRLYGAVTAAQGVRQALTHRREVAGRTDGLIRVAELASGRNAMSMDLATYVLQARFASVVEAANEHLLRMSDGRLQLVTHDESEGRLRAGLGLRVIDLRTDSQRSPGTLSGGETFYTSLALALGLAGVVTAEAGGIDLDTLFVDEGFGTLDHETLDDVIGVLTGLRDDGRTVGMVSHVEDLKNRIPDQIRVRRDGDHGPSRISVTG